ncbi:MAG: glucosaminidase domain-containing protein [Treponema sp.]|nr:glucosaminidase domain-containing protein [Treponema sp.]
MRRIFFPLWTMILLVFLFYSCSSVPEARVPIVSAPSETAGIVPEARPETPGEDAAAQAIPELAVPVPERPDRPPQEIPLETTESLPDMTSTLPEAIAALPPEIRPQEKRPLPERPEFPPTPERIMGTGRIPFYGLALFLLSVNPDVDPGFIEDLALYYTEEAAQEGINHDVAFAQMCLETGFLRYGGLVTPDMNNFCGLGSIGPGQPGECFPSPRIGARAHIQHLKAYATDAPLRKDLVDPRYFYVRYGSAPTLDGLAGSWAVDREYSKKIRNILERLYAFAFAPSENGILVKTEGLDAEI